MVRSSGLVHAFIGLFEALWTLGMPVSSGAKQELLSDRDRAIITLMADVRAAERGLLWVRPLPRRAAPWKRRSRPTHQPAPPKCDSSPEEPHLRVCLLIV